MSLAEIKPELVIEPIEPVLYSPSLPVMIPALLIEPMVEELVTPKSVPVIVPVLVMLR
ncbi:hypothetical protein [Symbiopectobacterium purcellii]|uniref:hypothetical protein n=1 Tax=Symbiopectobacterium purcellii TaxID=2871826 RepID=UPI003F863121